MMACQGGGTATARPIRHHATRGPALLGLVVMALLVGCRAAPSSDAPGPVYVGPPPNFVVIVVDDLR